MEKKKITTTITLRVTQTQRQRLDLLTSYMDRTASYLFGERIDDLWERTCKDGTLQAWLNELYSGPQPEKATEAPSAKSKALNM